MITIILEGRDLLELRPSNIRNRIDWTAIIDGQEVPFSIPGINRTAFEIVVTMPAGLKLVDAWRLQDAARFRLTFGKDRFEFSAFVSSVSIDTPLDGIKTATAQLRVTGPVTMEDTMNEDVKKPNPRTHRFYVASPGAFTNTERGVSKPWAKETYAETREQARQMLAADPTKDEIVVVKVYKIIRRKHKALPIREIDVR